VIVNVRVGLLVLPLAFAAALSACGGGAPTYTVSGNVTGSKSPFALQDGAANEIQVAANGPLNLASSLANGASYAFTVKRFPINPLQSCTVTNGMGVINGGNVTNVRIDCIDALTVTTKVPADLATNVSPTQPLSITFSAPLDRNSLAPTQIHLTFVPATGNQEDVPLALAVTGNQLTLTPTSTLRANASYLLSLTTTAVRGTAAEPILATIVTSFETGDAPVGPAGGAARLRFDTSINSATFLPVPRLATDTQGRVLVAWNQVGVHGQSNVWSSSFDGATGWSTPTLIDPDDTRSARNPDIGVDNDGNALAVWERVDAGCANIFANQYTVGTGWAAPTLIDPIHCDAHGARVAVNAAGAAVVVWYQTTTGNAHIWARSFLSSTWGALERVDNVAGDAAAPQIATDGVGNAIAVWEQFDGTRKSIWANRYSFGSGWDAAQRIESNDTSDAQDVQLVVDSVGNALAVWQQADGGHQRIWSNTFRVTGGGWETAAIIGGSDAGDASRPQIAVRNGKGFVVWQQSDGARTGIVARRFESGAFSGAVGAVTVLSDASTSASFPQIAVDPLSNAVAVWSQKMPLPVLNDDAAFTAMTSSFTATGGWSAPQSLEAQNEGAFDELHPEVAIDANGMTVAAWDHVNFAGTSIWTKRKN